jgi:sterol desaturase/sphingolipid hydroxylase (fatty acid hydroxylase superfamily)
MFVPIALLGVPTEVWVPIFFIQQLNEGLQHSEVDWSFGPLHRVFVSPVFHALHHSTQPSQYTGNYGKILSVWDHAFGTAVAGERPTRYGVEGLDVPETIQGQLLAPLQVLRQPERRVLPA